MAGFLGCYHHSQCFDRSAVSNCSKCGKGMCVECTDTLRSPNSGQILCVDCLNAELNGMENRALGIREQRKKELIYMVVGGVIGLILGLILMSLIGPLALIIPFAFASFVTIWRASFGTFGFLFGLIVFVVLMVISPIMLLVRVISRIKERKQMLEIALYLENAKETNNKYLKYARNMKSGNLGADMDKIRAQYAAEVAALELEAKKQREAREAQKLETYTTQMSMQDALAKAKAEAAEEIKREFQGQFDELKAQNQKEIAAVSAKVDEASQEMNSQMKDVIAQQGHAQKLLDTLGGKGKKKGKAAA